MPVRRLAPRGLPHPLNRRPVDRPLITDVLLTSACNRRFVMLPVEG